MWVRTQNKKELVYCISFSVTRNFGGKKKQSIVGAVSNGFWGEKTVVLGFYETSDIALNELTRLQDALANETKVFEIG